MGVDEGVGLAFLGVMAAALAGLAGSVLVERLLQPSVPLRRHWAAWALHAGLWLCVYGVLAWLLGRPGFAMLATTAIFLTLVLVNNAKFKALREPFVFQDYEYFTDAVKHPRLYIPFLGWGKFLAAAAGFVVAVVVGLWLEPPLEERFSWSAQSGALASVLTLAVGLLWLGHRHAPPVKVEPEEDLGQLGFLAALWRYAEVGRRLPKIATPFSDSAPLRSRPAVADTPAPLLVSVQSESFFDARALWSGIRASVLADFDRLRQDSATYGQLQVPAWGANTVRTEFAFLAGVDAGGLGVHRFNPYRALAAGMRVASLASWLKQRGYRTICIHPYPASFYLRDRVFPHLGFDEFIDIGAFGEGSRYGPYVADRSVGRKVSAILREAAQGGSGAAPVYVHVITMENHGPLHLERVRPKDIGRLYTQPPPAGCDDLTVYLRHLRNADRMLAGLRHTMENLNRPASLCWYGDHVPIMPTVYQQLGAPAGEVEYAVWANWALEAGGRCDLPVHELARRWMQVAARF